MFYHKNRLQTIKSGIKLHGLYLFCIYKVYIFFCIYNVYIFFTFTKFISVCDGIASLGKKGFAVARLGCSLHLVAAVG